MNYKPSILQNMARLTYSLLLIMGIPIALFLTAIKKQKIANSHKAKWRERFGFIPKCSANTKTILMHCVSVGEVNVAARMIKEIRASNTDINFTITTTTATGSARVKAIYGNTVEHFYLPYDVPICMAQMLKRVSPVILIIVEVELWPNLINRAWKQHIPIVLLNARMTDRSARRYAKLSPLLSPVLHQISHVCAQGQRDYDNYMFLGLAEQKLTLTNNLKFDMAQTKTFTQKNEIPDKVLTLLGASTHEGEEQALLTCVERIRKTGFTLRLILAPRHPERFSVVATWLRKQNQSFIQTTISKKLILNDTITLIDEMGRLDEAYAESDIAFVGGSLIEKGGHNALEPAAYSLPIVMGPFVFNNPEICSELEAVNALKIVNTEDDLFHAIFDLCRDSENRIRRGRAAHLVLNQNIGAATASLKIIQYYMN